MLYDENNLYPENSPQNTDQPQHPSVEEQLRNYRAAQEQNQSAPPVQPTHTAQPVEQPQATNFTVANPAPAAQPPQAEPISPPSASPAQPNPPINPVTAETIQSTVDSFHTEASPITTDVNSVPSQKQSLYQPQLSTPTAHTTAQAAKPVKEKKNRWGVKIAVLALCCALLGGAAGAGISTAMNRSSGGNTTSVSVSNRTASEVTLKSVDGKKEMTDSENYAVNVNSAVSINSSAATTNYFGQRVESASSGSGFIITSDGYIATNYHVIDGASNIKVTLYNGETYDATVIGGDSDYDIAVLKIDATGLQAVTLGNSDSLNVGDHVLAIGNPLGELTFSMSGGMVSCVNRPINVDGTPFNMIQTDTSINPGNSGGPLLNSYGEVVGIVSAKYASLSSFSSESVEGLGFAIPINDVAAMIQDIMTNGYVTNKPYLGITPGTINENMAQQTDLVQGVYIYSVESGSAAEKAGLKVGDVITKIDDTTITSLEDLTAAKKGYSAGDTSTITISRSGKTQTVQLTWGTQPASTQTEDNTDATTGATPGQGNNDQNDQNMQDLFDYFFNQGGMGGYGNG